jgi:ATP/maltotriose-dependent transcriptional regulator MalT
MADGLAAGREAFGRKSWARARELLAAADSESALGPEDLMRLALATYLIGRQDESIDLFARTHQSWIEARQIAAAARCAFWIGFQLLNIGDHAQAGGWFARARRLLDETGVEGPESALLLLPDAVRQLLSGEAAAALAVFESAAAIGEKFNDVDLCALANLGLGQALIRLRRTDEGMALLDELMVTVTNDAVSPHVAGLVYCAVISACHAAFDLPRAREWTESLTRWCAAQPDLVPYRGQCTVHRAQLLQWRGAWDEAMAEAERARDQLLDAPDRMAVGTAFALIGDLRRLRGDFGVAEDAYRDAIRWGASPQPGLAWLRLGQGQQETAASGIRRAVDDEGDVVARCQLLPACVEIMLKVGDVEAAAAASESLSAVAGELDTPLLRALDDRCRGAVLLAQGAPREAYELLRQACRQLQGIDALYEVAHTRVLIAQACRALGDEDAAGLELDAARWMFERLGARPDLAQLSDTTSAPSKGGLTGREIEVLALVAAGNTNRQIAASLVISEKTVARHVSNIFSKIGVTSRAAATSYAYQHDLV